MRSLIDMVVEAIQRQMVRKAMVAIFGPDFTPTQFATGGPVEGVVTGPRNIQIGFHESPWVAHWRRMGVDDPVAAARTCEGRRWIWFQHLGVTSQEQAARLARASDVFRSAGRAMAASAEASRAGFAALAGYGLPPQVGELARWLDQTRVSWAAMHGLRPEEVWVAQDPTSRMRAWIVRRVSDQKELGVVFY